MKRGIALVINKLNQINHFKMSIKVNQAIRQKRSKYKDKD